MGTFRYVGLPALEKKALNALKVATAQACEDLVGKAMPLARKDTGALRGGIHVDSVIATGDGVRGRVSTGAETDEYSFYQHEGTRYMEGTHYLEVPLLEEAPVYKAHIAAAAAREF
jgi:hypothetical protein